MTLIFDSSNIITPFQNCFENGSLSQGVVSRITLDNHMVVEIFCDVLFECFETDTITPVHHLYQELVWVLGVQFQAFLNELFAQAVVDI